jgi:hypothetical protein
MNGRPRLAFLFSYLSFLVLFLYASSVCAQSSGNDRVFRHPKTEVDKAIQGLRPTFTGRLPTLEGFVELAENLADRYSKGFYECAVQTAADGPDNTRVSVMAKVTAWYTDPSPAQAGYRILISNGRLESDFLDRIEAALSPSPQEPKAPKPDAPPTPEFDRSDLVRKTLGIAPRLTYTPPTANTTPIPAVPNPTEEAKQRTEEIEKQLKTRSDEIKNLEEIERNQSHPLDLAVVRKSGTRVLAKPGGTAQVLFSADADDEFQTLDNGADWVHVQISGASRGWIRRADLIMPEALKASPQSAIGSSSANTAPYRVEREEVGPFKGAWDQLQGKPVKIVWVEPVPGAPNAPSPQTNRVFAKSALIHAYIGISSQDQTVAGVVLVIDSADGGQIGAPLDSLRQLQAGTLSELAFWKLCFIDPPDLIEMERK